MIKAVLFDMDGVLIDAADWHYEALNKSLEVFGYKINRYDHIDTYNGLPTSKKLKMLSKEKGLPLGLHSFINEMKQVYTKKIMVEKAKPLFCHELTLSSLQRSGYKLGVCTNSIRDTLSLVLSLTHLDEYFDLRLSCEECSEAKPSPEIYKLAMERLKVLPTETLIVEDSPHGITAARESGAHVLVVKKVLDVNLENIKAKINEIEREL